MDLSQCFELGDDGVDFDGRSANLNSRRGMAFAEEEGE
jgi:hypothetical protein